MTIESANYLGSFDHSLPVTGDQLAEGDDHIRMMKAALKQTFPGRAGADTRAIAKGAGYTPASSEVGVVFVHTATLTVTLPAIAGLPDGTHYVFKGLAGTTTVTAYGSELIDGAANFTFASPGWSRVVKTATGWTALMAAPATAFTSPIPAGSRMLFAQNTTPVGWTRDSSDYANNRMLRVVTSGGNGAGGSYDPTYNNVVTNHTHTFNTSTESADHVHGGATGGMSANASHSHTFGLYPNGGATGYHPVESGNVSFGSTPNTYATSAANVDHTHSFTTGGRSAAHTHSGTSDGVVGAAVWYPRYLNLILCSKD